LNCWACGARLADGEAVNFAEWLHPSQSPNIGSQAFSDSSISGYRQLLKEGDFCIDIGAHTGDTTLPMGIAVGKTGCVLALEPNPYVYHVLEKNARANRHLANIRTLMAAAGSEQGFLEFEYSDAGFCNGGRHEGISAFRHGHAYRLPVFCVDLAAELRANYPGELENLRFIKVDAEGFDLYVLKSLLDIIDEHRPTIKAEVFKKTSMEYRLELLDMFESRNYAVHEIIREPLEAGQRLTQEDLSKNSTYDIICIPGQTALEFETAWRPE
jgi:FkbM family methyltransferase